MDFFISFLSTHLGLFGTQDFTKKTELRSLSLEECRKIKCSKANLRAYLADSQYPKKLQYRES
jgi:hypothetical protein